ncbi:MAG: putative ABC transporter ATP-binding protein [Candidatus Moanabacter tarae]|uniref:Putative ABC transporter ATP-binding protein n=1 Tax=Candidatus Moanibacter tarae TaxID=2200854 RepID=A0A2Z4AG32_9BACT|nr:MAG: putative ABC transporter ATP-binding protein [Candidatus Moanabacter tarae]|tara:strand:- start:20807 stop:22639 length:1833 start_codon:yes stop_codon:yes gene_type:complete
MQSSILPGSRDGPAKEEIFGQVYDKRVVARMLPYLRPQFRLATIATVAMLIYTCTLVAIPYIIKHGIDGYIVNGEKTDFPGLTLVFLVFLLTAGTNWASNYWQQWAMIKVGQRILYSMRRDMFNHLQKLSLRYFEKTEVGRIISRVLGDVNQLQEFMALVVTTMGDFLSLIGIVSMLLVLNLKLGLISMAVLPILIVVMGIWQIFARQAFMRVRQSIAIVNSSLNENISGIRVVQSMNRQGRNMVIFEEKNNENLKANLSATKLSAILMTPVDILTGTAIAAAIYFGAGMVAGETLRVGALIAFILYIQRFFDPIRNLTMQYGQFQRSMASGIRIFDLLDTELEIKDTENAKTIPPIKGEIAFQNVTFSYIPGEDVLKNVSFKINPGETVAIVGPTGAGKTTLISLISRFYDVPRSQGSILVDGFDIRDVQRNSLARQMSMVLQEPFLFSATVAENIRYNHLEASDQQIIQAAKAVDADGFITKLDQGYGTYLAERGVNLSVGQRQLISFARAIVADPRILILDEATANIDSHTELLIQSALQKLLQNRTAIIIAHRLSTIQGADKIIVLQDGEIAEIGNHSELMSNDGLYKHLYKMTYASIKEPPVSKA